MKALPARGTPCAFTMIELLSVIAIITVITAIAVPAIFQARETAAGSACQNNLRQLQLAWLLYAQENDEMLVPNITRRSNFYRVNIAGSWVLGNTQVDATATNLRAGLLFPYVKSDAIYRCPRDRSSVSEHPGFARTRSYAMEMWLNSDSKTGTPLDELKDSPLNLQKFTTAIPQEF